MNLKRLFVITAMTISLMVITDRTQAQTVFTLKLVDFFNLTVNEPAANLTFDDANDFTSGRDTVVNSNITISARTSYDVRVKVSDVTFNGTDPISTDILQVSVDNSTTGLGGTLNAVRLGTADADLISAGDPVIGKPVNIKYAISATDAVNTLLGKTAGGYTATVTYSITAP